MSSSDAPVATPDISIGDLAAICAIKLQARSAQRSCGGWRARRVDELSVPIRRISPIELAQQRRPGEVAVAGAAAGPRLHPLIGVFEDVLWRVDQLGVAGQRHDLNLAGALEAEQNIEGCGHRTANHEQ